MDLWMYTAWVQTPLSHEFVLAMKTGLRVSHFVGLVLGLGAATLLDLIIIRFLVMRRISNEHCQIVEFASKVVTVGLAFLWISGIGFLIHYGLFDPAKIGNQKVWAKVAIVAVLTLNGVFIHSVVLPTIRYNVGRALFDSISARQRNLLLASGVISGTSWYVPLLLGSIPQLNFVVPAWIILSVYATMLIAGIVVARGILGVALPYISENTSDYGRHNELPLQEQDLKLLINTRLQGLSRHGGLPSYESPPPTAEKRQIELVRRAA